MNHWFLAESAGPSKRQPHDEFATLSNAGTSRLDLTPVKLNESLREREPDTNAPFGVIEA